MIATTAPASRPNFPLNLFAVMMTVTIVGAGTAGAADLVLHLPMDDGTGSAVAVVSGARL